MLYISHGNVPSKWAHSFQALKMADALSERVRLTFLTRGSVLPGPAGRVDLRAWYGLRGRPRIVRLPVHWRARERFFREIVSRRFDVAAAWYARLTRPDLVYTRSVRAGLRTVAAGLPTVVEVHTVPSEGELQRELRELRELATRPALRGLVTVTPYLAERYGGIGIPADKLLVCPDAVDLPPFAQPPERAAARRALGLPPQRPLALYAGHFYAHKGVPCLIDAARSLPDADVCLVGGWPRDIEAMRRRAKDAPNVRFAGFVPNGELPGALAAADVLVLPNSAALPHARATSPLKLFEYMAARRPVAACDIPAFEGLLSHGRNALLCEPDRPEALAAAIRALLEAPERGARLAEQAWKDVQAFTWEARAGRVLKRFAGGRT